MKFENQLEILHKKFIKELPMRFQQIETLYHRLAQSNQNKDELRQLLHRLVGLAGTFKAFRISEVARNLEIHLSQEYSDSLQVDSKIIDILFNQLQNSVKTYLELPEENKSSILNLPLLRSNKTICLVEDDPLQAEQMALALKEAGYQVVIHHALPAFSVFLSGDYPLPSLIIMDMLFANTFENGASAITQLREKIANFPPVIFVSILSDVISRLNAIRAGASEYLVKPISNEILIKTIDKYFYSPTAYKVLVIDDDDISAQYVATILEHSAIQSKILLDPLRVFEELDSYKPDLLILDIYMPNCSGIELARIIRQCACYKLMPIVFLTANTQLDQEIMAYASGGDELIRKTDSIEHLLYRIGSRLQRLDEIRQINNANIKAKQHAEQMRIAQHDLMTYVIHELKTPLNTIMGYSGLLKMDSNLTEEQQDMLGEILRAGDQQMQMISELSERTKINSGTIKLVLQHFEVKALLDECCRDLAVFSQNKSIHLINQVESHPAVYLYADRHRVGQIINNLLTNAIKYNKPGGSVWLSIEMRNNSKLRIVVRDNGRGIAANALDYVFEDFERLSVQNEGIEGIGIGLSICRQLAKLMGGKISMESELNVGSSFWLELPKTAIKSE